MPNNVVLGKQLDRSAHVRGLEVGGQENLNDPLPASPTQTAMMETGEEMNNYSPPAEDPVEASAWARTVLGLSADPSDSQISNAYRKLAIKWHPDRAETPSNGFSHLEKTLATERFQDIQAAYSIITAKPPHDADRILAVAAKRKESKDQKSRKQRRESKEQKKRKRVEAEPIKASPEVQPSNATPESTRRRQMRRKLGKAARLEKMMIPGYKESATSHLLIDDFVVARDFREASHLDGKTGVIISFDKDTGTYLVNFEGGHGQTLLKPHNLVPLRGWSEEAQPMQAEYGQEAKAPRRAKATSHLFIGVFVLAKGLNKAEAFLNGKAGVIKSFDKDRESYLVNFEGGYGHALLKPHNLAPMDGLREEPKPRQAVSEAERKQEALRRAKATQEAKFNLDVGVFVVAKHLNKEAAVLNGKTGVIKSFDEDQGSYLVEFEGNHGPRLLKPYNLDPPWSLS